MVSREMGDLPNLDSHLSSPWMKTLHFMLISFAVCTSCSESNAPQNRRFSFSRQSFQSIGFAHHAVPQNQRIESRRDFEASPDRRLFTKQFPCSRMVSMTRSRRRADLSSPISMTAGDASVTRIFCDHVVVGTPDDLSIKSCLLSVRGAFIEEVFSL